MDGSVVFARWRQCAPHIQKAKNLKLPWQRPYVQGIGSVCILFSADHSHPSITNCLVAIVLTKPVIVILVPKLVVMATSLGASVLLSNTWFLGPIQAHNPNGISIGSPFLHSSPQSALILYNGTPISPSPQHCLFPWGSGPHVIPWAYQSHNPNGILIGSAVFAGLTSVTNRPTDRPTTLLGR